MTKKNYISAAICLVVAVAVMVSTSMSFLAARELPLPEWGPVEHRRRPLPEELEE